MVVGLEQRLSIPKATAAWRDWQWLLLLLVLVVPLRAWMVVNTEVLARDSIGFIRYALLFDQHSWAEVVQTIDQHPGYPWAVWAVSVPMRRLFGPATPELMRLCAQLVSGLAAIALVLPSYYLGKALAGPRLAFGGSLLVQWLPTTAHHLSDGISESLFLFLLTTALWSAVRGCQNRHWLWFAATGAASGLAYLTRPEGLVVSLAVAAALVLGQALRPARQPWTAVAAQALALLIGLVPLAALYTVPAGRLTRKPALERMLASAGNASTPRPLRSVPPAMLSGDAFVQISAPMHRLARGCWSLAAELAAALHYLGFFAVMAALPKLPAMADDPGRRVVVLYFLGHAMLLVVLATAAGYLSDRHVIPMVLLLAYAAAAGLQAVGGWCLSCRFRRRGWNDRAGLLVLAGVIVIVSPQTLARLHGHRAGNHAAGLWLAEHWRPGDIVIDDHCWSHYYARQVFFEGQDPTAAPDHRALCYVVITRSRNPRVQPLRDECERRLRGMNGQVVYHWPPAVPAAAARVVVYAVPRSSSLGVLTRDGFGSVFNEGS
ncbi:MAG: glycosyltransferase family 39 protein [Gemmataceae bacterium]|nr:glycosyltransferase family 39 protein [Gemmataceae bacterium]